MQAWIVHLTGENDPDADTIKHPQYFTLPFYDNMARLLQRANLAISRAAVVPHRIRCDRDASNSHPFTQQKITKLIM